MIQIAALKRRIQPCPSKGARSCSSSVDGGVLRWLLSAARPLLSAAAAAVRQRHLLDTQGTAVVECSVVRPLQCMVIPR
ncbi:unnamed protein product [Arctogadus glacialis]